MKKLLLITLMLFSFFSFSQRKSEINIQRQEIEKLKINQLSQKAKIEKNSEQISLQKKAIDSLESLLLAEQQSNRKLSEELNAKIQTTDNSAKEGLAKVDKNISSSRIYWIIGLLATALLGYLLYSLLGKKINTSSSTWEQKLKSDRSALEIQIQNTKKSLEEESVKLDSKLVELLETQQKLANQNPAASSASASNAEPDHSFALKVADEIVRIQKNIQQMDASTKGLKQLSASVKRIQENFISQGYEVVDMLGNEYNDGMKVIANFVSTDDLPTGKQVITRIIKPQVNFQNEMIQAAQIEVSVGE